MTRAAGAERIARVLARAGMCSRREAERWIAEGRVAVGGKVLTSPALNVDPADDIRVDGKPLPVRQAPRLWRYHKPAGRLVSRGDPRGRQTIYDELPKELGTAIAVGRLDLPSEGLLLLTNDGAIARYLELPATGWTRRYRARAWGEVDDARLAALARGVTVDGVRYGSIEAVVENRARSNAWLSVTLREGKNREVRRVLEHIGLKVNRLIRVSFGPFQLGGLEPGAVREVPRKVLSDQLPQFFPKLPKAAATGPAQDALDDDDADRRR